ncbi:MAG TPA: TlyA family RNA methyltransferase [Jatrophihabitans sp.]|jgi:23S rRNA (cytidine1920-2'-O)/16S rRNA (cytidine1409-2'-O)-methyltransferase
MPARVHRLDAELTRRGLARSREHAVALINAGRVEVRGVIARKPASGVAADTSLRVIADESDPNYASRGGFKLAGALQAFPEIAVSGKRCLDAGASTGGFTDVLLRSGARQVIAVDVGYGQLAWNLRTDDRVIVHDRTNVRTLTPDEIGGPVDLSVADLSFISLQLVLPALIACTDDAGDIVPMVKPQFEVGKQRLGSGGVVRNSEHRADAVVEVARAAAGLGWASAGVCTSPLPGPSGNVEFFLWLTRTPRVECTEAQIRAIVEAAAPTTHADEGERP